MNFDPGSQIPGGAGGRPSTLSSRAGSAKSGVGYGAAGQGGPQGPGEHWTERERQKADLLQAGNEPGSGKAAPATKPWSWDDMTPAEKIKLVEPLIKQGLTYEEIATKLGAPSKNSISSIASRFRAGEAFSTRHNQHQESIERNTQIGALAQTGASKEAIAAEFGLTVLQVVKVLSKLRCAGTDIPESVLRYRARTAPARPKNTGKAEQIAARKARVLELARANQTAEQIAKELGVSVWVASKDMKDLRAAGELPQVRPGRKPGGPQAFNIGHRLAAKAEGKKAEPIITKAGAFDPIPGSTPVEFGTPRCCKWPVDGFDGRGLFWCGLPRAGETGSYCHAHRSLGTRPETPTMRENLKTAAKEAA